LLHIAPERDGPGIEGRIMEDDRVLILRRIQNYRTWIIWWCPSVRFLDYQRVREAERKKAEELFGTHDEPTALASKVHFTHLSCASQNHR